MPEYKTEIIAEFKDRASAKMAALGGQMKNTAGDFQNGYKHAEQFNTGLFKGETAATRLGTKTKGTTSHLKAFGTSVTRTNMSVGKLSGSLKMLGLIGVGTMAALFMNTPIMQAAFEDLRVELELLALTLSEDVIPEMEKMSDSIRSVTDWLEAHPIILDLVQQLVALGARFSIVMVLVGAFGGLLIGVLSGIALAASILVGRFVGLVEIFGFLRTVAAVAISGISLSMFLLAALMAVFLGGIMANWDEVWAAVLQIVGGVLGIIEGLFNVFAGVLTLDLDRIVKGFGQQMAGVRDIIVGIINFITAEIRGLIMLISTIGGGATSLFGAHNFSPNVPFAPQVAARNPTAGGSMGGGNITISFEGASFGSDPTETAREIAFELSREQGRKARLQ